MVGKLFVSVPAERLLRLPAETGTIARNERDEQFTAWVGGRCGRMETWWRLFFDHPHFHCSVVAAWQLWNISISCFWLLYIPHASGACWV